MLRGNEKISFDECRGTPKVQILKADVNCVLLPGEDIEITSPLNFQLDKEFAIEPRIDGAAWYEPRIIKNDTGVISLTNENVIPIKVKKGQILGQARSINPHDPGNVTAEDRSNLQNLTYVVLPLMHLPLLNSQTLLLLNHHYPQIS